MMLIGRAAGRGAFKGVALIGAFVIIIAAWLWRLFGADRALLLIEGVAIAKVAMPGIAYLFRRR